MFSDDRERVLSSLFTYDGRGVRCLVCGTIFWIKPYPTAGPIEMIKTDLIIHANERHREQVDLVLQENRIRDALYPTMTPSWTAPQLGNGPAKDAPKVVAVKEVRHEGCDRRGRSDLPSGQAGGLARAEGLSLRGLRGEV